MDDQILSFIKKFAEGRHNEEEHEQFLSWLKTAPEREIIKLIETTPHFTSLTSTQAQTHSDLIKSIESTLDANHKQSKTIPFSRAMVKIAAVFILLAGIGALVLYHSSPVKAPQRNIGQQQQRPLGLPASEPGRATLTLADGSTILLDSVGNGLVAMQSGIKIRKTASGEIVYDASSSDAASSVLSFNTVATPKGRQFQLTLPDGTRVWLNAGTALKFPAFFSATERIVELNGEAYFEVAHDKSKPFRVNSRSQTVEVLGTHFNIYAYSDEDIIRTTLVEGSIKLLESNNGSSQILKPGQQANFKETFVVRQVDPREAIAWKEGYFNFAHEDISSIMKKISRWYDVDVQYKENVTREGFVGKISHFEDVSDVLKLLEFTGSVHFKTEGRIITVLP